MNNPELDSGYNLNLDLGLAERRGGVVRYRKERKERPVVNECEDDEEGARAQRKTGTG